MMRRGDETAEEERARFKESRRFCKAVEAILGEPPDIVFEHVGKATFPTSVLVVRPFGKVVICGATSGYQLDFDVRYLWMRQKEIIGSHFANAWEATKANQLIEESKVRPVLWQTMGFEKVAEAHQLLRDNKHLGKIAILVGATEEGQGTHGRRARRDPSGGGSLMAGVMHVDWYATVLRQEPFAAEVVARRAAGAALRRDPIRGPPLARRPLQDHADGVVRLQAGLVQLLGGPGDDRVPPPPHGPATRSRSPTRGTTSWSPARSARGRGRARARTGHPGAVGAGLSHRSGRPAEH